MKPSRDSCGQRELQARLAAERLAVVFQQHVFRRRRARRRRAAGLSLGVAEHVGLPVVGGRLAGKLAFALGQDDQRPEQDQAARRRRGSGRHCWTARRRPRPKTAFSASAARPTATWPAKGLSSRRRPAAARRCSMSSRKLSSISRRRTSASLLGSQRRASRRAMNGGRIGVHGAFRGRIRPRLMAATSLRCGVSSLSSSLQRRVSGRAPKAVSSGSPEGSPRKGSSEKR